MTFVITSCDQTPSDTISQSDTEISSPSDTSGDSSSDTSSDSDSSTSSDPVFIYEDYYNDYYDSIESWEDGDDLREQLRALVNLNVNLVDFNNSSNIWAVNQLADETLDNYDRVEVVYGNYQPLKTFTSSGANGGWQREHAFAQSLGDFDVASIGRTANESLILRSDFHNLFASDGSLNGSRNNLNLGNVSDDMGAITNPKDSFGNNTECYKTDLIFQPPQKDQPMLARAIFYMATRFDDLDVVEDIASVRSRNHGMLSDLLDWSDNPVTRREYKHNIGVYHFQNNRNPYVDFPELVDYVFGDKQNESGELRLLEPSYYDVVLGRGEKQANDIHNLAVKNVKIAYEVGEFFSKASDLSVFTVNNDLTFNSNLAISEFTTTYADLYHFVDADIGKKTMQATHQTMNVNYEVDIKSNASSLALYKYVLTSDDAFKSKTAQSTPYAITLGGLGFDFFLESGSVSIFEASAGTGRKFGTNDNPIHSMYL
ncbi:MAG: hypothetical protein EOM79_00795, partial [Epsilonproteobacteria bacterium]|nr:hypothetical protein [Campylobacterota bacterium]